MIKALLKVVFASFFLWAAISLKNGFNDFNNRPGPDISTTKISYAQALSLFEQFVAQENISFGYTPDGCYARATAMTLLAESKGIEMAKLYVEGSLNAQAYYSTEQTMWGWHVVPVVEVEMPDGHSEILVFDPSLFNRPVTVQEFQKGVTVPYKGSNWGYNIPGYEFKPEITRLFYGFRYQYFNFEPLKSGWEVPDLENTVQTMLTYKSYQPKYPPLDELKKQKGDQVANKDSDERLKDKINELGGVYPEAGEFSTGGILWPPNGFIFDWSTGIPFNGQSTSMSDTHHCSSVFLEAI